MQCIATIGVLACGNVSSQQTSDGGADAVSGGGPDAAPRDADHLDSGPSADAPRGGDGGSAGGLLVSPATIDFHQVSLAAIPAVQTITITNTTTAAVLPALAFGGPDASAFSIGHSNTCATPIAPAAACTVDVAMAVGHSGTYQASLDVTAGSNSAAASVTAQALTARLTAPGPDDFGDLQITTSKTRVYTLTNSGEVALSPVLSLTGAGYAIDSNACAAGIPAGASCQFVIRFQPAAVGPQHTTIAATAGAVVASVELSGRGTAQLTITKSGTGTGSVTGAGLSCDPICTVTVTSSPVTLTATPDLGETFASWSGAASCASTPTCSVPIETATVSVTASFRLPH